VLARPAGSDDPTTMTFTPLEAAGEVADEEVTVTVGDETAGTGILVVKRGPNAGSRFWLAQGVTTVGRSPSSGIFLDDVTVSRLHARITRGDDGFVVSDVSSLNGTYLNRQRIDSAALHSGDELQIGKFRLVFLHEAPEG
jgi:pSer/pThr/pTyr-binding forkhead associated (FHA) protein